MMHRCSSSQGNMVGPCSCGLFHSQSNSFSMLLPNYKPFDQYYNHDQDHHHHHGTYSFASPSSSVDCTLSLGTPSTRLSTTTDDYYDDSTNKQNQKMRHERRNDSCVSNFCWDLLQPNSKQQTTSHKNGNRSGGNSNNNTNNANDPLLARRCANCDTTSTPLWRNGPRGPKVCIQ